MAVFQDLTGQRFGRWTVLGRSERKEQTKTTYFRCRCDCGTERDVAANHLKRGATQSCGCLERELSRKRRFIDYTGQKFFRLTVLEFAYHKNGHTFWKCRCDCGTEKIIDVGALKEGHVKSCGCWNKEIAGKATFQNLTGQRFGKLLVLERAENAKDRKTRWLCRCDCGNEIIVRAELLKRRRHLSCGCEYDLTGQKFGKLTVVEKAGRIGHQTHWRCKCDCGNETVVGRDKLIKGVTKSCGCLRAELNQLKREDLMGKNKREDLMGKKFGKLTVLKCLGPNGKGRINWLCQCECGTIKVVASRLLLQGVTKSCGDCSWWKKLAKSNNRITSRTVNRTKNIWYGIKSRCFNPKNRSWHHYGGRGITMADEWVENYTAFFNYVSKLPHFGEEGYTLDRIDVNGNYEPDNVRWADAKTQARNKTNNVFVEYEGVKMTLAEAAEKSKVNAGVLSRRLKRGETGEYLFRLPTSQRLLRTLK